MKIEAKYLDCLKEAVEKTVGKKMNTPRDFDLLSIYVYNLTNEHLSSTTLKRLWGYQIDQKESSPRILTLDTVFMIGNFLRSNLAAFKLLVFHIKRQIARISLQILLGYFLNILRCKLNNRLS